MPDLIWLAVAAAAALLLALTAWAVRRAVATERARRREVEARQLAILERQQETLAAVAPALATEIRGALESYLVPVLGGMVETLNRISLEVEARQRDALEEMARSFNEQLTSGLRDEFGALARALLDAAEWHERVQRDLGTLIDGGQRLGEGHVAMLRRTLQVSEAVRTNAESLSRAERSLELSADRVQASATTITKALEGTTRTVVDRLRETTTELSDQLTRLTGTLNEQMEQASEQLSLRIQGITLMLQRVASDIDTLSREQRTRPGGPFPRGY